MQSEAIIYTSPSGLHLLGRNQSLKQKTATSTTRTLSLSAVQSGTSLVVSPESPGSTSNMVPVSSCHVTGKRKLGVGLEVMSSAGTRRLFETRRLLPMWLSLDPAYKRDRRLFEGGFYSSIYGTQECLSRCSLRQLAYPLYHFIMAFCYSLASLLRQVCREHKLKHKSIHVFTSCDTPL